MATITIAGIGYVGLSNAVLFSQHNKVFAVDIVPEKVEMINNRKSPISDKEAEEFLSEKKLDLTATLNGEEAYSKADIIIISTPTNYNENKNFFDTSSVESVIEQALKYGKEALIVIKSTVPVGFTENMRRKYDCERIIFSPEFLREGKALYDNLYPSRIIVGVPDGNAKITEKAHKFAELMKQGAVKENVPVLFLNPTEAEAVKLFSNTYLALRVSYFNELDTYAELKGLDSKQIIKGVGLDPRIGEHYNNPSFGYGGYCLPKDTKQMLANFKDVPENLIEAIVKSNDTRKIHIAAQIIKKAGKENPTVGIYRLIMKANSDNFRQSAVRTIMKLLKEKGANTVVFEPALTSDEFCGFKVIHDFNEFVDMSDVIAANRVTDDLSACIDKVYTRDMFFRD